MSKTWNPITTAPKGKPILVTDDKYVWLGKVSELTERFTGVSLQTGDVYEWPADYLTGWLPAPATMWEPQKTADEMFDELGYKKVTPNRYRLLETVDDKGLWTYTEIIIGAEEIIKQTSVEAEKAVYGEYLSRKEALAVARAIREMEAEDNAAD